MNVIQINVSKQKLITKADFALVSGTKGKYGVQVMYDSEWDELPYKLLMIKGSKTIKVRDTGEIINIPSECIEEPCYLQFGLIGLDGNGEIRITTYSETKENTFYVHSSDWNGESKEDIVEPPTPTIWESLVTDIDKLRVDISLCKQEIIENKQQISALFDIIENFPSGGTGGNIVVDSELSMESKNPVQNKVVAKNFSKLSDEIDDFTVEGEVHLNLNDEVYIRGYIHNATEEDTEYYQSYKSANYLAVVGGKTIKCFSETTNFVEIVEYDYKYKFIKKTNLYPLTNTEDVLKSLTLSDDTRYIRISKFSGIAGDMGNARISIYYSEDAVNEYTPYSEVTAHTFVDYKMIQGVENNSIKVFGTVMGMKNCTILKSGDVCTTLGYHTENDGGKAQYLITDKVDTNSDTYQEELSNGLYATLMHDGVINVRQLGATGVGQYSDSEYLQKAFDLATKAVVIPSGKYKLNSKVYVRNKNNFNIYANEAMFLNDSNDYAFQFTNVSNTNCYFHRILGRNTESGGLEFYSIDNSNYVQYMNIHFTDLLVKTNCIYIHGVAGWVAELRFHGGRFGAYDGVETAVGCKIDANQGNEFTCDHFSFYNIGIEGIKTGFYFIGKEEYSGSTTNIVQCVNITDCRFLENFTTLLRTEGIVRYIRLSTSCIIYAEYFDLSEKTTYSFIEGLCAERFGAEMSWRAIIHEGTIIPQDNPRCLLDDSKEVLDLSDIDTMMSVYNLITIYDITTKLKLSKQYGILGGKNTFLVRMVGKNADGVLICDYEDNVISDCSNINAGDIVRFTWIMVDFESGYWFAEKVNTITITTT